MNADATNRRELSDVVADILSNLSSGPLKKTHISHKSNMDSRMTNKYLSLLDNLQLIQHDVYNQTYFITQKGHQYLDELRKMANILELTPSLFIK